MKTGIVEEKTVWQGKAFDFGFKKVILPNGKRTEIGCIHHPGSSAILPISENGFITLVHQYRPVIGDFVWEIPSGTMLPGEDPLECAKRELQEECGSMGKTFEKLGEILVAPWYSDERIFIFMATDLVSCQQNLDEDEFLTPHLFTFDQALSMVEKGEIQDATTIIGLKMAYLKWKKIG